MKNKVQVLGILLLIILVSSCRKENQTALENMEQIYKEQGVPVKIRTVGMQDFSTYLTFTSSLKGIKESTGSSLVSDTVEDVLVKVGDYVQKDQSIIRFPKNNPSANYYQAEAGYKAAEQALKRITSLYENNGVSRQSYDDVKTQYEVQKANWLTVTDMIEVKAPLSGYITRLKVQESDNVHPGDDLFTVSNFDELTTTVWVSDHEIKKIQEGQRAYAFWEGETLQGEIMRVDLAMDNLKKAFAVQLRFTNTAHAVPSGITADIDIETELIPDALVIHSNEARQSRDDWYVYVNRDGYAQRKIIEVGARQGMFYQVKAGLEPTDKLITQGISLVRDQSPLYVVEEGENKLAYHN